MSNAVSLLQNNSKESRIEEHATPSQEGRRPIKDIVADMSKPVPARFIRARKQGGSTIQYLEWHTVAQLIDHFTQGAWTWAILSVSEINGMVCVHGRLTIMASDGAFSKDSTGVEDGDAKFGDPVSNASAMCLKRCAALFGLGRSLYNKSQD